MEDEYDYPLEILSLDSVQGMMIQVLFSSRALIVGYFLELDGHPLPSSFFC